MSQTVTLKTCPQCGAQSIQASLICNRCQYQFTPVFPTTGPPGPSAQSSQPTAFQFNPVADTSMWAQRLMCFWAGLALWLGLAGMINTIIVLAKSKTFFGFEVIFIFLWLTLCAFGSYFFLKGHHGRSKAALAINSMIVLVLASGMLIAAQRLPMPDEPVDSLPERKAYTPDVRTLR